MPSVVHVVVTGNFAGVERYICNTATELAGRNWDVSVVGGDPEHMPSVLGDEIRWLPGENPIEAFRSLIRIGRHDLCHVHMTAAELVGVAARPFHRAPIISTRHFAAKRGSTAVMRALAPVISARLARELAVSNFVATTVERRPDAVIISGVPSSPFLWQPSSRIVLVLQRLEKEKGTSTALEAWQTSQLRDQGWSMRIVGDGSQRQMLESWARIHGIKDAVFTGWIGDVRGELAAAGILLAPAPSDSLGIAVLEAMAAGVPVVACGSGGHLETVGRLSDAFLFPAGDSGAAAAALNALLPEQTRSSIAAAGRRLVATDFTIARHVDSLLTEYEIARMAGKARNLRRNVHRYVRTYARDDAPRTETLRELVVCSLEAWDEVWRRNQFFTDGLLRRNAELRVLFVEPAADPLFDVVTRQRPSSPRLQTISADGRLRVFRPLKVLPRKAGPIADFLLREQVRLAARFVGLSRPTLWINDVTYAPLITTTRWPSLYDVTDDWLLARGSPREQARLRELDDLSMRTANEVVVCSPALVESRGTNRTVSLISNAVDVEHFRRPRPRPSEMPEGPVAVYAGSLHENRLDIELIVELAKAQKDVTFIFVGPNSLNNRSRRLIDSLPNVSMIGPRPYDDLPAYLQHADVVIVPHRVSPFTDSLDPIKAYECLAIQTPTVATPVAGFREHSEVFDVADRSEFGARVRETLLRRHGPTPTRPVPSWDDRTLEFESVLMRASRGGSSNRTLTSAC